jgi:AcrR family transcriptional regulator
VDPGAGLRERKKQQTRDAIAKAAFALFAEHGFDAVTVAAVARRADVSEATVFNYFPTKEDLVIGRLEDFEAALLAAIRDRAPAMSLTGAFRAFLLRPGCLLGADDPDARQHLLTLTRIVTGSRSLLARERQVYDDSTRALARLVAEETHAKPDDLRPWAVANALMGVHRALVESVRAHVLAGEDRPRIARRVRTQAEQAIAVLDRGLAGYPY